MVLIKSFLRSRLKLFLSIAIFTTIFIFITILFNYKKSIYNSIDVATNKQNNREITVLIRNEYALEILNNSSNIEKIEYRKVGSDYVGYIIVDDVKNINNVFEVLRKLNIDFSLTDDSYQAELGSFITIKKIIDIFTVVAIVFAILVVYVELKILINLEMNNISLLRILGYKKTYITFILIVELLIIVIFSSTINIIFIFLMDSNINILICVFPFLLFLVIIVLEIPLLILKIKNIDVTKLL